MIRWTLCALLLAGAADTTPQTKELGPVKVTTALAPREPTIGDEITLEIRVEAQADVEILMPEFGESLNRYSIVDFVPKQRITDDGTSLFVQRYTLQPYLSGKQSIPPILIEFVDNRPGKKPSPDDLDAYEILTDRIDFEVKSVVPENAGQQLKPPLGKLDLTPDRSQAARVWAIAGGALLVVAIVATVIFVRRRRRHVKRRNAYDVARSRLNKLLQRPHPEDQAAVESFFVDISSIVRRYLEDRFEVRAPELTTEEFLTQAGSAGDLLHEHQALLRDFLRQADLVKFAGLSASEGDIRLSTELAIRFLEETRENAPMIDDPDARDSMLGAAADPQPRGATHA